MTQRFEHLRLRLIGDDDIDTDLDVVKREFPTIQIERALACGPGDVVVDDHAWRGSFDLRSFDEKIEGAGPTVAISIRGYDVPSIACEVVTRYQRCIERRNEASSCALFGAVLSAHVALYDISQPHVKSDLDHAIDTWQWVLRLSPAASFPLQIAALFHDFDRLESDPRERIEHRVRDGQSTRDANARKGAERISHELTRAGVSAADAQRACAIVFGSDRQSDAEVRVLDDADALSFLSLNSSLYSDYFGVAQTRRKVAYTLSRLGPIARQKLDRVRLRPDVERLLRELAA